MSSRMVRSDEVVATYGMDRSTARSSVRLPVRLRAGTALAIVRAVHGTDRCRTAPCRDAFPPDTRCHGRRNDDRARAAGAAATGALEASHEGSRFPGRDHVPVR